MEKNHLELHGRLVREINLLSKNFSSRNYSKITNVNNLLLKKDISVENKKNVLMGGLHKIISTTFSINRKKFQKEFAELLSDKNVVKWKKVLLAALVIMLASSFLIEAGYIKILVLSVSFLVLASFYMWIFVRAIEKSCMYRLVEPSRLTEGDWIVKDIYVGKQYICGPKDLGISKNQIRKLIKFHRQKKIKKILIKEGIPFVPSFFIAFVLTLTVGNPVAMLL